MQPVKNMGVACVEHALRALLKVVWDVAWVAFVILALEPKSSREALIPFG